MKKLYIVRKEDDIKVVFYTAKVFEETETVYVTNADFSWLIKGAGWNFPKNQINKRLANGFVTNRFNPKKLREQVEKMYKELDEDYKDWIRHYNLQKDANDLWREHSLREIEKLEKNKSKNLCIL